MPAGTTSIVFDDGTSATLTNGKPNPANRFDSWTPDPIFRGTVAHRQSDLTPYAFPTARLRSVTLQLSKIPVRTTGGLRLVEIAERLRAHLLNAGSCIVNTGDVDANSYSSLYLVPETRPTLELSDRVQLEYTLTVSLFAPAGTVLNCRYDA